MAYVNRQQAEQLLKDPRVVNVLNAIAKAEGADYGTIFGGQKTTDLSRHPNIVKKSPYGDTTAAGRYQFLTRTWNPIAKEFGLTDFGQHSQDLAAVRLLSESGALNDILSNNITGSTLMKLGKIWSSIPGSPHGQKQRSISYMAGALGIPVETLTKGMTAKVNMGNDKDLQLASQNVAQQPEQKKSSIEDLQDPYESFMEGLGGTEMLKQYFPVMASTEEENEADAIDRMYNMALQEDVNSDKNQAVTRFVTGRDAPTSMFMNDEVKRAFDNVFRNAMG